jgi:membrane protein YdbS with pleckstrin-like domain
MIQTDIAPPPEADLPSDVQRYLLPGERLVANVRRHPAVLIGASAQAIAGLLVAFVLTATLLRNHSLLIWIVWGLWVLLMLRLIWEAWNWAVDYFVITSKRILLTSGVFTRNVAMMPLGKVTDMSFRRTFTGRMLGYGDFIVESAGQDQALRVVDHVPYPEDLYQKICDEIFFEKKEDKPPACALDRLKPGGSVLITRRGGEADESDVFDDPDGTRQFEEDDYGFYPEPGKDWLIEPEEPDQSDD